MSGFAIFSRNTEYVLRTLASYFAEDTSVRCVVLITHPETDEALTGGLGRLLHERGIPIQVIPWETYGQPEIVRTVSDIDGDGLVFVSTEHHRTVRNRLDPRRGYVRRKAARKKIAIDSIPYEVMPWRIYFPFAFFDTGLLGYHHSYAIEQDYERFLDGGLSENPCAVDRIVDKTAHVAFADRLLFERRPEEFLIQVPVREHEAYAMERDHLFASEKTITGVKTKLHKWIQARHPERAIPLDLRDVYDPAKVARIVRTDLLFDQWLAREAHALMDHTDGLLWSYQR